jgi:hypothetical protein
VQIHFMLLENNSKTVFLPWATNDLQSLREDLMQTLKKAGFKVLPEGPLPNSEEAFKKAVNDALLISTCSIHILGNEFGPCFKSDSSLSFSKFQFIKSKEKTLNKKQDFKLFVWHPVLTGEKEIESEQLSFINELENNIEVDMTYSNTPSTIQLADDIRSILQVNEKIVYDLMNADIFFINNLVDETSAAEVLDMLSDIVNVEKLSIRQDSGIDYAELSTQQIKKSKMAVVYFKNSSEWAIPFAQQIWKNTGGATSSAPILVIGDEDPETNKYKKISAPKIISVVVMGVLIPLEIKFQFDKLIEVLE